MKFRSLLIIVVISGLWLYSSYTLAADQPVANPPTNSDLQQQLQNIQQSINQANAGHPPAAAVAVNTPPITLPAPPGTTVNVTTPPPVGSAQEPPVVTNVNVNPPTAATAPEAGAPPESGATDISNLRDEAFVRMTNTALPLSPSQIEILRNLYDATQRASAVYPGTPPRPTSTSIAVNLSPGAAPPVIRLGAGFVTSLVFVDSTGSPWPIDSYSLGNPTAFNIQWDKKSNILLIQAISAHRTGNLAVILKGLNTPVMIDLSPGQAAMDVRVDLRIPRLGPSAALSGGGIGGITLPGTEDPFLLNLLDGIPPPSARSLKSSGCDNCAWLLNGKLYLRTQYTVISPAWLSTMASADGTHVYEMEPTPLILATYNGKTIKLNIEGF
jgi:intracellular multiplication protein IcmK